MTTIETPAYHDPRELDAHQRLTDRHPPAPAAKPPAGVDQQLAPTNKTIVDRTVETLGLPYHPDARTIASHLRAAARLLEDSGTRARKNAAVLAARGWPAATLGDGLPRAGTPGKPTERAARVDADTQAAGHWDDVDIRYATLLRVMWRGAASIETMVTELLAHGSDVDELPAGHGECRCCGRFCQPSKDSNDRLRAGYCNACRMAWERSGRPQRTDFEHARRHRLFDGQPGRCDRCGRPWTAVQEPAEVA